MRSEIDWLKILVHCKDNVKVYIQPYLKTLSESEPDLGRGAGGDPTKPVDLATEKATSKILYPYVISLCSCEVST